jgi:hypothetical protein
MLKSQLEVGNKRYKKAINDFVEKLNINGFYSVEGYMINIKDIKDKFSWTRGTNG